MTLKQLEEIIRGYTTEDVDKIAEKGMIMIGYSVGDFEASFVDGVYKFVGFFTGNLLFEGNREEAIEFLVSTTLIGVE